MASKPTFRFYWLIAAIVALPLLAYSLTYAWVPMDGQPEQLAVQVVLVLALVAVFLAFPYWMIKLATKAARERDPEEREVTLRDLPKDQEQLRAGR